MQISQELGQTSSVDNNNLAIHVHFSPHGSREDLATAENLVRSSGFDIYAPELPFATPEIALLWPKLAKGDTKIYNKVTEVLKRRNAIGELAAVAVLYACRKPIIIPDITQAEAKQSDIVDRPQRLLELRLDGFENDLNRHHEGIKQTARNVIVRNEIIARRLPAQASEVAAAHPRLRDKEEVRVLATMGSRHTYLYHLLKDEGYSVTRSFNVMPMVFQPIDESARAVVFNGDVSREVLMQSFKQVILARPLANRTKHNPNNSENFEFSRRVVSLVSDEQAEELYESLARDDLRYADNAEDILDQAT